MTFRLPDDLAERLKATSERSGVPQARIVRDALEDHLDWPMWKDDPITTGEAAKASDGATPDAPKPLSEVPTYRCPRDCKPDWRPLTPTVRCPACNSKTVPA